MDGDSPAETELESYGKLPYPASLKGLGHSRASGNSPCGTGLPAGHP